MSQDDPKKIPRHYYLVAAKITFREQKGKQPSVDDVGGIREVNAILQTESTDITAKDIGRAQQAVQIEFHKRMNNLPEFIVMDVVISNLSYLGYMSPDDFQNHDQVQGAANESKH